MAFLAFVFNCHSNLQLRSNEDMRPGVSDRQSVGSNPGRDTSNLG